MRDILGKKEEKTKIYTKIQLAGILKELTIITGLLLFD
jgi:hypothetical protein